MRIETIIALLILSVIAAGCVYGGLANLRERQRRASWSKHHRDAVEYKEAVEQQRESF